MGRASRRRAEQRQHPSGRPVETAAERPTTSLLGLEQSGRSAVAPPARSAQREWRSVDGAGRAGVPSSDGQPGGSEAFGRACEPVEWGVEQSSPRRSPVHHPPPGAHGRLRRLVELRAARASVEVAIEREVDELVALGTDWGSIGRALGVSRQAARQRYGR